MKKILLGTIVGVIATITVQKLYRNNHKFRSVVNNISRETGIGPAASWEGKALNIFDRLSLIYQRLCR